jgi:hypothetical protein
MRLASTIVYAAIVHCSPATEACSWRPIDGTATLTAVLSSPTMNTAEQQTASTPMVTRHPGRSALHARRTTVYLYAGLQ